MPLLRSQKFRRLFVVGMLFFILLLTVAITWICWIFANSLTTQVPRVTMTGSPDDFGATNWREASFTTSDGLQLRGWYIPPAAESDGATILMVHGHGGSRLDFVKVAPIFIHAGYGLLMFDLRGSGASDGEVVTMACKEVWDVEAAFDYLTEQPEVNPDRIALYGHSMGGASAIQAMTHLPQARALIVSAAYASFPSVVADGVKEVRPLPAFPIANVIVQMASWQADCDLSEVRPIDDIAKISPRPILFIQGSDDGTVQPHHTEELFATAHEPKTIYRVEGAGHGNIFETNPAEYERRVLDFLSEYLRGDYPAVDN